jgi:hypothetical protein
MPIVVAHLSIVQVTYNQLFVNNGFSCGGNVWLVEFFSHLTGPIQWGRILYAFDFCEFETVRYENY